MCSPRVTRHISIRNSSSCHTRVNMGASTFFVAAMIRAFRSCRLVVCVLCTKCTLHSNHRLSRVIFQHTKRLLPRSGHFLTTYTRIAKLQKCELRWKTIYWGKKLSCSFYLYSFRRYVSYGFPIIKFCNPRVWVDNIRMDLQEVGCGYMDWIGLAQDSDRWRTLVSAVMNLRVPWNAGNFLISCKPVSFSRRTLHHRVSK